MRGAACSTCGPIISWRSSTAARPRSWRSLGGAMSAPKEGTWTPLSKALAKIDDAAEREAQQRDLWSRSLTAIGVTVFGIYPILQARTGMTCCPIISSNSWCHNPVFDAVTYEDTTIWLVEILLPNLPNFEQADTPVAAEPQRGRPSLVDEIKEEAERLQQQEGRRYPTRASLGRAVMRRVSAREGEDDLCAPKRPLDSPMTCSK